MAHISKGNRKVPEIFNRNLFFKITLWVLAFLGLWVQVYYYPLLPPEVATHFNAFGQANGWSSKWQFCSFNVFLLFGMAALFHALIVFLPKLPSELINVPYRSYWLAPERKKETMKRLIRYLLWIGNLTMLFLFGMSYLIVQANYFKTFHLSNEFWLLFGVYISAVGLLTVELLVRFFRIPKNNGV